MTVKVSNTVRTAMANSIISAIDANGKGKLCLYDGVQPVSPDTAVVSQKLLSEHELSVPCGTALNGVLTFNAIAEDQYANNSGAASWARIYDGSGTAIADASVSVVGGTGDIHINTINIIVNGPIRFSSLQWKMPGG